jgi:threonine dehydrogenase-like Zn-dependent dehydrogenase
LSGGQALVLNAPRELAFEPLENRALEAGEIRIRTLFSGISAGTELSQYRGTNPFMHRRWDEESRLFVESEEPSWPYPVRNLGYEESGEIIEIGSGVRMTSRNSAATQHGDAQTIQALSPKSSMA